MSCSCCCYFTPHCTGTPGRHGRYPRTTKLEQVCRRPRGRSECRRVTPRTGLQPGAGTLERTVPRVCVGSATGAETAPRITREWRWNGPVTARSADAKWKIEKSRFSRLNTAPSPDLCSPACPPHAPTSLGREGGTGWARGSKKSQPPNVSAHGFLGGNSGNGGHVATVGRRTRPADKLDRAPQSSASRTACGRLHPLRQGLYR